MISELDNEGDVNQTAAELNDLIELREFQRDVIQDKIEQGSSIVEDAPASYNPRYKDNLIVNLTFEFASGIWDFSKVLQEQKQYDVSRQVLRSGTAIGALVREAQNAESKKDFIHKMKIALKEADETEFWLLLCMRKEVPTASEKLDTLIPIIKVLNKIISRTNKNMMA